MRSKASMDDDDDDDDVGASSLTQAQFKQENQASIMRRRTNEKRAVECLYEFQNVVNRLISGFYGLNNFHIRSAFPLLQELFLNLIRLIISPQCQGVFLPPFRPLFPTPVQYKQPISASQSGSQYERF